LKLFHADYAKHEYAEFLVAYGKRRRHSTRSRQVQAFAVDFRDVYEPGFALLDRLLQAALYAFDGYDPANPDDSVAVKADFEQALDDIAANRAFLPRMAAGLAGLAGASDPKEMEDIGKLLAPADTRQGSAIIAAADPARERAMAENIAAAEAPLLVKVGDGHVESLQKLVGPSVVAIRETQSLEDVTKQPPAP
jgi:hypothetical protein